jgi:hypothetical protein
MKRIAVIAVVAAIFGLSLLGCMTRRKYHIATPILPKPRYSPNDPVLVDSFRPTFRWSALSPGQTFDFAIWEASTRSATYGTEFVRGQLFYSKSGIIGTEYRIDRDLPPHRPFYWSVKPTGTTEWATYDSTFVSFAPIPGAAGIDPTIKGVYFLIATPWQ